MQWRELLKRVQERKGNPDDLRLELVNFRSRQPPGPHAREVARLIAQIASPLDRLEWAQAWPAEKAGPRPPELIAVLAPGAGPVRTLAFSPEGRFLAAGGDQQVRYWNLARFGSAGGKTPIHFAAHSWELSRVAFAPDGRHFASACLDGTCKVWDTKEPGCVLALKPQAEGVTGVAFSPDGKTLATAGRDGKIRLWDRAAGGQRHVIDGKVGPVHCLAFSPDGRFVFWGGENHQVRWTDLATRTTADQRVFAGATAWVNVLAFHPSGEQLILGGGGTLYLCGWDGKQLACERVLKHHRGHVRDLAFSPDGARFLSVGQDKSIHLCDGRDGALLKSWGMHVVPCAIAFAPDGRHFAAGTAPPRNHGSVFLFRVPASIRLANR
jgi:WD40 repeat protein